MTDVMQRNGAAGDNREGKRKLGVVEQMPLSERSVQVVEAGLAEYQRIREESTRLAEELSRAESRLHMLEVEINIRDREVTDLRNRCAELEQIVDRKTGDYAVLETMLYNVKVQLDTFMPARNAAVPPQGLVSRPAREGQGRPALLPEKGPKEVTFPAGGE